jgi:hypothetical protein
MTSNRFEKFANLSFKDFRQLASDNALSCYEKIGFPDMYRKGKEKKIVQDIISKLTSIHNNGKTVLDVGPGCSEVATLLIEHCRKYSHRLILVDCKEMLDLLPTESFIVKVPAYYPDECPSLFEEYKNKIDVILTYSVLHYVFKEGNLFNFIDKSLSLLADRGQMLIGDIPNISKRKRFFSSPAGVRFHQRFMKTDKMPSVSFNTLEEHQIDDSVIMSIISRSRNAGFDAYWLPQQNTLPMANRREDILIIKP